MEMCIKVNGSMMKCMGKENSNMQMEFYMKGNYAITNSMVMAK